MCGVKIMDRKNTDELMDMLELDKIMDKMAKANRVRWYGHVKDFSSKAFHLTLFRGNRQNEAELKPN